jgi:glycerol-3-phosphate acyltransferase PlsX
MSKTIGRLLKNEVKANPLRMLGGALAGGAFRALKQRLDPEVYGGAALLGLNGIVIKAHGSSRERAIASAIRVAAEEVRHDLNRHFAQEIAAANLKLAAVPVPAQP